MLNNNDDAHLKDTTLRLILIHTISKFEQAKRESPSAATTDKLLDELAPAIASYIAGELSDVVATCKKLESELSALQQRHAEMRTQLHKYYRDGKLPDPRRLAVEAELDQLHSEALHFLRTVPIHNMYMFGIVGLVGEDTRFCPLAVAVGIDRLSWPNFTVNEEQVTAIFELMKLEHKDLAEIDGVFFTGMHEERGRDLHAAIDAVLARRDKNERAWWRPVGGQLMDRASTGRLKSNR